MPMTFGPDDDLDPEVGRTPGRVVVLNGTSSAGKSTTAKELIAVLAPDYFHLGIDMFRTSAPGRIRAEDQRLHAQRLVYGFHRAVAGFAAAGNNVVMDHLLGERWRVQDMVTVFAGYDVVLVGVHCSPVELRRREQARGNRGVGRAESQLSSIHAHVHYDVEIDTSATGARECATTIADHLANGPAERAFTRLSTTD